MRKIGLESRKTFQEKAVAGFFEKFMSGQGLDIGYKGYDDSEPILPTATGIDIGTPGYNGTELPFETSSQDYVYSSHALEHIGDWIYSLREWFRVLKPRGHLVVVVPHQHLYEKKDRPPSRFNPDHKRFYTPAALLNEIEKALLTNTYRIRHLRDNDEGHDYNQPCDEHSKGCYEIELVIEKLP